jgi:hypothetical protein
VTLALMLYGGILGVLLAGSAHFLDRSFRALGWQTRWTWVIALAAIGALPLTALLPGDPVPGSVPGTGVSMEALYTLLSAVPGQSPSHRNTMDLLNVLLPWCWIGASLVMAVLLGASALRLHRRSRRWVRRNSSGREIMISDGLGPAVFGFFRPRVVLPPWTLGMEPEDLRLVLLHELEHSRARDPALLASGIFMVILAPWNPALWWGLRRLRLAVEGDCDRRVLAKGVSRRGYARLLLNVASGGRGLFPLAPALAEGGGSLLERRLKMMRIRDGRNRVGSVAVATLTGSLLLFLACETPTPHDPAEAQASPQAVSEPAPAEGLKGTLRKLPTADDGEEGAGNAVFRLRPIAEGDQVNAAPLIYIDGKRIGRGEEALEGLSPDEIDRIEVIKGKAAEAAFGEAASGGVIQIFLKR